MQNIMPFLVFPCLLGVYGIYLAIAAFVSDFVWFITGSRSGKINIRVMDTQEKRIKTSLVGMGWVCAAIVVSFFATNGQLFHIFSRSVTDDHGRSTQIQDMRSRNFTDVGLTKTATFIEIYKMEPRQGVFQSATWDDDLQKPALQYYTVNADLGSDIHAAVVARIIALMRERQHDTIYWHSARLGRIIALSMRPENGIELSRFLSSEFFGLQSSTSS